MAIKAASPGGSPPRIPHLVMPRNNTRKKQRYQNRSQPRCNLDQLHTLRFSVVLLIAQASYVVFGRQ